MSVAQPDRGWRNTAYEFYIVLPLAEQISVSSLLIEWKQLRFGWAQNTLTPRCHEPRPERVSAFPATNLTARHSTEGGTRCLDPSMKHLHPASATEMESKKGTFHIACDVNPPVCTRLCN